MQILSSIARPTSKRSWELCAHALLGIFVFGAIMFKQAGVRLTMPWHPWTVWSTAVDAFACAAGILLLVTRTPRLRTSHIAAIALLLPLLLFSYSRCWDGGFVLSLFVAVSVSRLDLRQLCRTYAVAALFAVVVSMALSFAGILPKLAVVPNARVVFTYGYPHPNTTGALIFGALSALTYAEWHRTWRAVTALSVVSGILTYVALSSHAAAASCILLACSNLVGHLGAVESLSASSPQIHRVPLIVIPLILLGGMLVLTAIYDADNALMARINSLTHNRVHYAHAYYVELGGFTAFGRPELTADMYNGGSSFWGVDSGYSYFALDYGLIPLAVLAALYLARTRRLAERHDFALTIIILLGFLYLVIERAPLYLYLSPWFLFLQCKGKPAQT